MQGSKEPLDQPSFSPVLSTPGQPCRPGCGGSLLSEAAAGALPMKGQTDRRSEFTQDAPPSVSFTSGSHLIKPSPPPHPSPTAHPTQAHAGLSSLQPGQASTQTLGWRSRQMGDVLEMPIRTPFGKSRPQPSPVPGGTVCFPEMVKRRQHICIHLLLQPPEHCWAGELVLMPPGQVLRRGGQAEGNGRELLCTLADLLPL